ncbi:MAG: hypothetical protein WCO69_03570 [Candidatus Omnitrophota bacterium]
MKKDPDPGVILGWAAVLVLLVDILVNFGDWTELLWFCTITTALLAYALFRKNALVMTLCLIMSVPAQILWVVDFFLYMAGHGMGRTELLAHCGPLIFWGSLVIHTFVIPVSFWGVRRLGFHPRALGWAVLYGAAILLASYYTTPPFKNVNCVFFSCDGLDPGGGYWAHFWVETFFQSLGVAVVSFFIFRFLFRGGLVKEVHAEHA